MAVNTVENFMPNGQLIVPTNKKIINKKQTLTVLLNHLEEELAFYSLRLNECDKNGLEQECDDDFCSYKTKINKCAGEFA